MNGKSSTDLKVSIDVPPAILEKLQHAGYRFIRIIPKSKDPIDRDYPHTKNYSADDLVIRNWISRFQSFETKDRQNVGKYIHHEGYGNYGVLCSDTLVALDLDRADLVEKVRSSPLFSNALSAQSGSGKGLHVWIKTDKAKTTKLADPVTKENIGHIKAAGGYVVGPSCIHPTGGRYHIINDGEIPFVPFAELTSFFTDYIQKRPEPLKETFSHSYSGGGINIQIEKIMYPIKGVQRGSGEIQGEHPVHGSTGGKNLSINVQKGTWFCHRCESGGGPAEAIAVTHGLIDCDEARPGCLRGDIFKAVVEIAEAEYGWTKPIKTTPRKPEILKEVPQDETFIVKFGDEHEIQTNVLPDELPADCHVTLIDGYPRIGKTHWSELQAIKHLTANIIANTHSVLEQHLRIFRENRAPGQTAVHLEGRNRCCLFKDERRSCEHCSHYPYSSDPADRGRFLSKTVEMLHNEEILTKEDTPEGYCPYFFMKECAKIADYVFTVPENLEEITGDTHQTRHLTIIDEDTCFANFFPSSADLAEFIRAPHHNMIRSTLETKWIGIERWKRYITDGKKRPKGKTTILQIIEILEKIRDILRIKDDEIFTPGQILKQLEDLDISIPDPEDTTKPEIIKLIERWEIPDTFSSYAKALLYPYKDRTFAWQGHNPMKLRLIANEEERIYDPPDTKMILIGSTRAEMFLKTLETTHSVVRINRFQYSKHFLFIVVKPDNAGARGKSKKRSYKHSLLSALKRVSHVNANEKYPLMILTGTKKEQEVVMEELGGICKGSSDENITGQRWNYMGGFFNVFYQNSVISRGIDLPFQRVIANYSSDFANPYWTARRDVALETRNQADLEYVEAVIDAVTVDETTNSTLRITPVPGYGDEIPRVVIISQADLWKIKPAVIAEAQVVELEPEQLFDNIEDVLEVTGRMELLPERQGIVTDDDGVEYQGSVWSSTVFHIQPEAMLEKPVEEKCKILADILKTKKADEEKWRRSINPKLIESLEKQVIEYLIRRKKEEKRTIMENLQKWMISRSKHLTHVNASHILISMYKSNKIRLSGIGLEAKVTLPSTYHDPEKSGIKVKDNNNDNVIRL